MEEKIDYKLAAEQRQASVRRRRRTGAIHYKVKDESGRAISRAIYNVLGVDKEGRKDLLGMYVAKSDGANFWLEVLTALEKLVWLAYQQHLREMDIVTLQLGVDITTISNKIWKQI